MCGNLTLIGRLLPGESGAVPKRVSDLLRDMLHVSQLRGAQSGGGAALVSQSGNARLAIDKCMNSKRAKLDARLTGLMASAGKWPAWDGSFLVQTHVRFATSGPATREESHPFRFVDVEQRGMRRVFRPSVLEIKPVERAVETAITHNGDFNALTFRGVRLAFPELGYFLERVLHAENRWAGDSPSLAGAFELFLTQGLWYESLRLAYLELIAPPPPNLSLLAAERPASERVAWVRQRLLDYDAPAPHQLNVLAEVAEEVWLTTKATPRARLNERDALAQRLGEALSVRGLIEGRPELITSFARRALDRFLDSDLFRAAREVERIIEGTFGCVITSTLEPDCVVAFARGQPLSLGVQTSTGIVAIVSERNALRVRDAGGQAVFDARFDFDAGSSEIARVATAKSLQPLLTLYSAPERRTYQGEELERSGRLVSLHDNALTPPLPIEAKSRVQQDFDDLPTILRNVRQEYAEPNSHDRRSAETLAYALLSHPTPRLLVLGITNDLWLAQQFASNLRLCLRGIHVEAMSSNQFLKESTVQLVEPGTVVLAVSQSGQDFPTLAALHQLRQELGEAAHGRLFVLSGEADSLMGQAVGQSYAKRALWLGRILTNCGGYRPSEAATASVNATHAALCELVFAICECAREMANPQHQYQLADDDLETLRLRRDALIDMHVPMILSDQALGHQASAVAQQITRQSRRLSRHILEGILAFVLAGLVLEANLVAGWSLKPSWLGALLPESVRAGQLGTISSWLGSQVDVLYYLFLTPLFVWLLRALQGRAMWHRHGVRELLIGDIAYVRQTVWLLSRKLFSLSYGFASLKPYAADNQDELVMTHEPLRGSIGLFGIPDERRELLQRHAAAAQMTARQFASSRSFRGAGAEVITLGPGAAGIQGSAHLTLPAAAVLNSHRTLDLLVEGMFDSWERMLAMQSLLSKLAAAVAGFYPLAYDPSRTKDQVFAPTTASPVSAPPSLGLKAVAKESIRFSRVSLPFEVISRAVTQEKQLAPEDLQRLSEVRPRSKSHPGRDDDSNVG